MKSWTRFSTLHYSLVNWNTIQELDFWNVFFYVSLFF